MKYRKNLILALLLAGSAGLAAAQSPTDEGQTAPDQPQVQTGQTQSGQDRSGQNQSGQNQSAPDRSPSTSADDSAIARTAPAAALSGLAGIQAPVGTEDTSGTLPELPQLLGGRGISSSSADGFERSNYLRIGANVGAAYDDNPLLLSSDSVGNASVSVFPNISISQAFSRVRWTLGYAGGLTVNQRFTSQDQGSHNLNFDSDYRLSPHVNLRVAESFAMTTGYFDSGGNNAQLAPGAGSPNTTLITPLATERTSLTTVETNYHFARNDLAGASGSFYDLHFTNPSQGSLLTELTDSQTETGSAFWLHRMLGGNWGGATYRFDRLTFTGGDKTLVHSFFAVDTLNFAKHFSLTGYAGPQLAENDAMVASGSGMASVETSHWSFAGGIEGGWQNQRTGIFGGYSRSISDGGGILGAVLLQNEYASFRRQLFSGWTATVNAGHGSNQALLASQGSIDSTSAGIAVEHNLGRSVGFRFGYTHEFQQQSFPASSAFPSLDANQNRVFVTLSYQWAKPLGR